jgi:hypothetical protein
MPKQYDTNSLGYKLRFNGPATVEEYDQAAGRVGACLEDACDNTIYRGTLPEWMRAFAVRLEEMTGTKRGTDAEATARAKARSKKPDDVKDVPEKVKAFHARVTASMSDADKNALNAVAQEVADTIAIDPSPAKRVSGPDKQLLGKADSLLTLPDDQLDEKVEKMIGRVEGFELQRDENDRPDRSSLARLVGRYLEALMTEV